MIQTQTYGKWSQKAPSCCGSHTLVLNNTDASPSGHRDICCQDTKRLNMMFTRGKHRLVTAGCMCVCVCVWTVGSLLIFALCLLLPPLFIFWSFLSSVVSLVLSLLAPPHPLIVLWCLLSFQYPPHPSFPPFLLTVEGEKGKLSHSFPALWQHITSLSICLLQTRVKHGLV